VLKETIVRRAEQTNIGRQVNRVVVKKTIKL
jgi:hypothetical protein